MNDLIRLLARFIALVLSMLLCLAALALLPVGSIAFQATCILAIASLFVAAK